MRYKVIWISEWGMGEEVYKAGINVPNLVFFGAKNTVDTTFRKMLNSLYYSHFLFRVTHIARDWSII